jgi:hypothetical protein
LHDIGPTISSRCEMNRSFLLSIMLCVAGCDPSGPELAIDVSDTRHGFVGVDYLGILRAVGGNALYKWESIGGGVPGLILSSDGRLSGTPTASGQHTVKVRVRSGPAEGERDVIVFVYETPLLIINDSFPAATVGVQYSQILLRNSGGASPGGRYVWSVISGSLPPGLALWQSNGNEPALIQGSATIAGTRSFRLQAIRTGPAVVIQDTASRSYSFTVLPAR